MPFAFEKFTLNRYLGAFSYRFNRRFNLAGNDRRVVACHLQAVKHGAERLLEVWRSFA